MKPKKISKEEWMEYCDNLTDGQTVESGVSRERWDLQWEVERLQKLVADKETEIGKLRFEKMMLKAELNARGTR